MVDGKRVLGGSLLVLAVGCGAPTLDTAGDEAWDFRGLEHDLTLGSSGTDVAAVHRYLHRYGYFPNDELSLQLPTWRAILAHAPSDPFDYDEHTVQAVRELQRRAGVPETGAVDAATRDVLRMPRCGYPDGPSADVTVKYALRTSAFSTLPVTWRLSDGAFPQLGLTLQQTRDLVNEALAKWAAVTTLSFSEKSSGTATNIRIDWINDANEAPGSTSGSPSRWLDVKVNTFHKFAIGSDVPSDSMDLKWVLAHELGHALGLGHGFAPIQSTVKPMMYFGLNKGDERRTLRTDDQQGISVLYDTWEPLSGSAKDVGIGSYTNELTGVTTQHVWHVGGATESDNLGNKVYKDSGSTQELATGGKGATRIAVDHLGRPWIVNSMGTTYRRSSSSASSGSWQLIPGCARDIAAAPASGGTVALASSLQVWKIDCVEAADGGGGIIKKWDIATSNWLSAVEGSERIALDSAGYPWVIASDDTIWQRTSKDPAVQSWIRHPGAGVDLAVSGVCATTSGADNVCWPWVVGTNGFVHLRNQQPEGPSSTPAVDTWQVFDQQATSIAVERSGRPWVARSGVSFNRVVK